MKNYKNLFAAALLGGAMLSASSCADDFADLNTKKDAISTASPEFLLGQAILEFDPSSYTYWFFNSTNFAYCVQTAVPSGSATETIIEGSQQGGYKNIAVQNYLYMIKYELSQMAPEDAARYQQLESIVKVLATYLGIYDTDFCGDITYTEAAQARYGGTLTPKYDAVKDLYDLFLSDLDECIKIFTTATNQYALTKQDVVYGGDMNKWAKLANSLKLKIAARLIHQDLNKAKSIVAQVKSASCGVMDGAADDFLFNKCATNTSNNDYAYQTGNGLPTIYASNRMIDFLVGNQDPRVRFIYKKNSWNSKVVDAFLAADKAVPSFIMENVETEVIDGKTRFKAWKGLGEPWVRYHGYPMNYNVGIDPAFADWFNSKNAQFDDKHSYTRVSALQEEMLRGRVDFTVPTAPQDDAIVIQDTEDVPWWGMYMSTAEVNLYLAEFALYENQTAQAQAYFKKAVQASVEEYNLLAQKNKIPYYGKTYDYDPFEAVIDLKAGEVETLLGMTDYQLTGDKDTDLEKVFLQQIIHFSLQPVEMFVTGRRSGCPKFDSDILARYDYAANDMPANVFPRRTSVSEPSPTDLMYDNIWAAYKSQGFSTTPTKGVLNSERVWQDQGAPQWGAGPNVK